MQARAAAKKERKKTPMDNIMSTFKHGHGGKTAGHVALTLVAAALVVAAAWAPPARAAAFGELGQVGEFGKGPGQFSWPMNIAVDTAEESVFVVDSPEGRYGVESLRLQKFSSALKQEGEATIPTPAFNEVYTFVAGIAVDPASQRLYILESKGEIPGLGQYYKYAATEILAYSTATLKPVEPNDVIYKFPLPSPSGIPANTLGQPRGLAFDPSAHDLVVLGLGGDEATAQVQRISTTGHVEAFNDFSEQLGSYGQGGTSITVGAAGEIYIDSNHLKGPIAQEDVGIAELAPDLSTLGTFFDSDTEGGSPPLQYGGNDGGELTGPQLAISPDGKVMYVMAQTTQQQEKTPGSYEVRGISTEDHATEVVFGGGTEKCRITSKHDAIAVGNGGVVYALDEGGGGETPTSFGYRLIKFGPGGSNCPAPVTSLAVDKHPATATITAQKGQAVILEAGTSELGATEKPVKLTWAFSGPETGTETVTPVEGATEAKVDLSHRFLTPGLYTVTLSMEVAPGTLGSPQPVKAEIEVEAPLPIASFEVFPSSTPAEALGSGKMLAPGEEATFNASGSADPAGGACTQQSGCLSTHALESYAWNFGDGSPELTRSEGDPTVAHKFANPGSQPVEDTVTLTVTNKEHHKSTATQTVTIAGTAAPPPPPPNGGGGGGAPPPPVTTPMTTVAPVFPAAVKTGPRLTAAQKLANALKACDKDKARRKRMSCVREARLKYGPKPKQKAKKKKKVRA